MKLLYVPSGHPLQEADDCLMWQFLDIDWFSTGYYYLHNKPGDLPYIKVKRENRFLSKLFSNQRGYIHEHDEQDTLNWKKNRIWTSANIKNIWTFNRDFIAQFDAIFFNFFIDNLHNNVRRIVDENKLIFFKTYGMHPIEWEEDIKKYYDNGVKVIRNAPAELNRLDNLVATAVIRGSVVPDEFEYDNWNGANEQVVTFTNFLHTDTSHFNKYNECVKKLPYKSILCGVGNVVADDSLGFVSHEKKIQLLRDSRVNLCTGTLNANNTYSMVEAWVMGCPLIVFGNDLWPNNEACKLIEHEKTGFIANSYEEARHYIRLLMNDYSLAQTISRQQREAAIKIYGRSVLAEQWRHLFNKCGLNV